MGGAHSSSKSNRDYAEATSETPCAICGKVGWCATDGEAWICMRAPADVPPGWVKSGYPRPDGGQHFIPAEVAEQRRASRGTSRAEHPAPAEGVKFVRADAQTLDAVYRLWLATLGLNREHRRALERRGLSPDRIRDNCYASLGNAYEKAKAVQCLVDRNLGATLFTVPGFFWAADKKRIRAAGQPGILVPVRDGAGLVIAMQLRLDRSSKGKKYVWFSSAKCGGVGPGCPAHVPLGVAGPFTSVQLVEGVLKSDVVYALSGQPTVGFAGVGNWAKALPLVRELSIAEARQ